MRFELLIWGRATVNRWRHARQDRRERDEALVAMYVAPLRRTGSGQASQLARDERLRGRSGSPKLRIALGAICVAGLGGTGYAAIQVFGSGSSTVEPSGRVAVRKRSNASDARPECFHLSGLSVRDAEAALRSKGFRVASWRLRENLTFVRPLVDAPPGSWVVVQALGVASDEHAAVVELRRPTDPLARGPFTRFC